MVDQSNTLVNGQNIEFVFIVPVYNRPHEIEELLQSLVNQIDKNFSIVIVEDGSTLDCKHIIDQFKDQLDIQYFYKPNSGPGSSRNYGFERTDKTYAIFVDSDCVLPENYTLSLKKGLNTRYLDCFGGPDTAHESFSNLQKAINYSMTAFLTTGGIRGSSEKLEKFNPRSFNMGFSKQVFNKTGGFPEVRFAFAKAAGEDLDLSITIQEMGFTTGLISEAFVYHKRRTNLRQYLRQVFNFGYARVTIGRRHKGTIKLVHILPTMFLLGVIFLTFLGLIFNIVFLVPLFMYAVLIFLDASIKNKSLTVGFMAIATSYIQLCGYGAGFLNAIFDTMRKYDIQTRQ